MNAVTVETVVNGEGPPDRIPILEPIAVQVRQLDPAIWGDTLTTAEAA